MPKRDDANLFEQHVEKAALALCLLLFAYTVFHWGLGSPRVTDNVPPDRIDAKLLSTAETIRERMDRAPVESSKLHDWIGILKDLQHGPPAKPVVDWATGQLPESAKISLADRLIPTIEQLSAALPTPAKPSVYPAIRAPIKGQGHKLIDVPGAHLGIIYPWRRTTTRWRRAFRAGPWLLGWPPGASWRTGWLGQGRPRS